ncbi:MAG: PucR family transcriptional regulator ligand-binding domain-containing protein [Actinomycetota bacterium]|nr:PucR family transcriptional regulator ligand-binding domain-containing protein [Actinomycetota bacterium]
MTIRVADLLDLAHLQLELLAGAGGLGHQVRWAHASDLPEPWNWLAGGELLMKNGRSLARTAAGQVRFLERLADAGVTALVIGNDPMTPALTRRARARAEEVALPVLAVPYSMSFIAISRAVADDSAAEQSRRLARIERIYGGIQHGSARHSTAPGAFVRRLGAELGHPLHVADAATGLPLLGSPPLDDALVATLRDELDRRLPVVPAVVHLPGDRGHPAVAVSVPFEEPTVLLATRGRGAGLDLSILHHAAAAVAVELTHESLRADLEAQARASVLTALLAEERDAAATDGEPALGVALARSRLVVTPAPGPAALRGITTALRRRQVRHLVVESGGLAWLLLEEAGAHGLPLGLVEARLADRSPLGVSDPVRSPTRVPEAAREARFALGVASERGGAVRYGDGDKIPALRDPAAARALVDDVLGPLLSYDERHGTVLVTSLAAFLSHRRSWSRAAAALRVHRQTVVYRMRRVSELTGRDLAETADLAELWLAVSAHRLLGSRARAQVKAPGR